MVLWTSVGLIVIAVTFKDESKLANLSNAESHIAAWYTQTCVTNHLCVTCDGHRYRYLVNGFFFNSMMDVFAGQFKVCARSCGCLSNPFLFHMATSSIGLPRYDTKLLVSPPLIPYVVVLDHNDAKVSRT